MYGAAPDDDTHRKHPWSLSTIPGRNACASSTGPRTLTRYARSHPSMLTSVTAPILNAVALLTTWSTRPYRFSTSALRARTLSSLETSVGTKNAASSPNSRRSAASASLPVSRSISAMTTFAPSQARGRAVSRPMPRPAPVTMHTSPAICPLFNVPLSMIIAVLAPTTRRK